jgi:hypothetical protein
MKPYVSTIGRNQAIVIDAKGRDAKVFTGADAMEKACAYLERCWNRLAKA